MAGETVWAAGETVWAAGEAVWVAGETASLGGRGELVSYPITRQATRDFYLQLENVFCSDIMILAVDWALIIQNYSVHCIWSFFIQTSHFTGQS